MASTASPISVAFRFTSPEMDASLRTEGTTVPFLVTGWFPFLRHATPDLIDKNVPERTTSSGPGYVKDWEKMLHRFNAPSILSSSSVRSTTFSGSWLILLDEGAMVLTALLTRLGVTGLDSTDLDDDGTAVERLSLFTSSDMKTSLSHSGTFERFGLSRDFRLLYSVTCPRGPGLPWDGTALYRRKLVSQAPVGSVSLMVHCRPQTRMLAV
mmetsp:Transcript_8495/g.15343  ORF Transcript_8495/g.15343 Transcript_8495/m.15343 type:complete len:211 (-) Transcript_8495:139-771(-)